MIKVGLIGYGFAARVFHAPIISAVPRLSLTHVVQRRGDEARERYPRITIVRELDALLGSDIDLAVIATPNATHFEITTRALRAGKHVVVDKPIAVTTDEAARLAETARAAGRLLSVYHNRRWDGDFRTVRQLVTQGALGKVERYQACWDRDRPVRVHWKEHPGPGGGLLYDLGPHLIDQALVLFGPPRTVTADVRAVREGAVVDDMFELTLGYDDYDVRLGATLAGSKPRPRFSLRGSDGSFVKFGLDPQEDMLRQGRSPVGTQLWGREPSGQWGQLEVWRGASSSRRTVETLPGCYHAYYEDVCDARSEERR